jgi:S-DNA-T family DNA segregation ATPase FtsK/SpoIIIE
MAHVHPDTDDSAIPGAVRRFIRHRLMEAAGLLLLALSGALAAALASWSALDPSLNRAFDVPVRNWLGWPGAVVSDELIMQLGLAVIAVVAVPVMWAGRLLSHAPLPRLFRRIGWWLLLTVALAAFLGTVPAPERWPLAAGLGGNIGHLLANGLTALFGLFMKPFAAAFLAGAAFALTALHALLRALDVGAEEIISAAAVLGERNQERIAAGLGGASHWRLSMKSALRNWRARRARARAEARLADERRQEEGTTPRVRVQRALPAHTRPPAHNLQPAAEPDAAEEWQEERPPVASFAAAPEEGEEAPPRRRAGLRGLFSALLGLGGEDSAPVSTERTGATASQRARREPRLAPALPSVAAEPRGGQGPGDLAEVPEWEEEAIASEDRTPVTVGGPVDEAFLPEELPEEGAGETLPSHPAAQPRVPAAGAAPAASGARPRTAAGKAAKKRKGPIKLPPLDILAEPDHSDLPPEMSDEALEEKARILEGVLEDFGVRGRIINVCPGPVVTLFELEPAPGIKSSRVIGLADDIARSMSAISARVAVVPGRNVIGIELPNPRRETVYLREMLESTAYRRSKFRLPLALGKNIAGEPVFADLARMPHLLIAGTTGSGKSVGINTFIMSLLYKLRPEQCRLIMIDPKMLELSVYEGIPHLLAPVVTDPKKAVVALKWAVREMEERYQKMAQLGVRNLEGYNARVREALKKGEVITRTVQTGFDPATGEPVFEEREMELEVLPYIVVIIDEMADLMMVAGKDIEGAVQRLAQMARAAGIHVIMATQRPSVDVITGTIKANFPTRISFQVTSKIDSRTILGEQGAEQLLGQGDMLYMAGGGRIVRLHGPFVSDEEVEQVVKFLKSQGAPEYVEAVLSEPDDTAPAGAGGGAVGRSGDDLYDRAVQIVLRDRKASTSYVQRRLQIGYNKAASLIERMEQEGIISAPNSKGRREILVGGDSASD